MVDQVNTSRYKPPSFLQQNVLHKWEESKYKILVFFTFYIKLEKLFLKLKATREFSRISGIQCVRLCSSPWWTCWQTLLQRRGPPGSDNTWWPRAGALWASLGAAAGGKLQRGKETERHASRNPPASDTAARTDAHEHRRPDRENTHTVTLLLHLPAAAELTKSYIKV